MFGFVLGILSVGALVSAFRMGARRGRWGGGWGRGAWGRGHRRGRSGRGGWMIDRILWRLGARPDQETEIRRALEDLFAALRGQGDLFASLRDDLASALGGDSSDAGALDGTFAKVEGAATAARDAVRQAFSRVHGILDAEQRARLADLLRGGGMYGRGCGPRAHPVQV